MNLYEKLEARVKKYREDHPEEAQAADEYIQAHSELFSFKSIVDDDLIVHVEHTPEMLGYEK